MALWPHAAWSAASVAPVAGRAAVAARQVAVTRRAGIGETGSTTTPAGSDVLASRGTNAMPSQAAISVSWVSNSATRKSGWTPGSTRSSQSWQIAPGTEAIHRS